MTLLEQIVLGHHTTQEQRGNAALRIFSDPGVPDPKSTTRSFWLEDPHQELAKVASSVLPDDADIVIIGSGITAASVARTIFHSQASASLKVVVLEARDVCTGATGRNGGHINEGVLHCYWEHVEKFGVEAARKIARFRLGHLPLMLQAAHQDGVTADAQMRSVTAVSVFFDDERFLDAKYVLTRFKTDMPSESAGFQLFEAEQARKKFFIPDAKGAISYPAGAAWPYKLVTGIFERLRDDQPENFFIESNTPVLQIKAPGNQQAKFTVVTARGNITASNVIHCTNAHVGHLVPGLRGRVVPVRGHMSAQTPGTLFPHQGDERSWSFIYAQGFDYLTQLPASYPASSSLCSGSEMMMGGGAAQSLERGVNEVGVATDSGPLDFHTKVHLSGALRAIYAPERWGEERGTAVKAMWTGSLGISTDDMPFVGKLPPSLTGRESSSAGCGSEWVAAGYSGEGMVNAWRCGIAVAQMVLEEMSRDGEKYHWEDWFPEQFSITEQRIKDAGFQLKPHINGCQN